MQWLDGQQLPAVNTVPQQHSQSFSRGSRWYAFSRSTKRVFGVLPRIRKNLLESESLVCSAAAVVKGIISDLLLFVGYFASQSKGIKCGDHFFNVSCAN